MFLVCKRYIFSRLILFIAAFIFTSYGYACTRVLLADHKQAIMVGRTMDWSKEGMNTNILIYPQGILRQGLDQGNSLQWTSQYGSIVATAYENYTTDGMNEKGLAAHILWLSESNYGQRDEMLPGLSLKLWAQFYLDNFQTVEQAVHYTETHPFQIEAFYHTGIKQWIKVHLALEDAQGDSAIIEYINGKPTIYHHPSYTVLTNSPTYDKQIKNLLAYQSTQSLALEKPLPGTTYSEDRFIRAAFYASRLPHADSQQHEIALLQSVINNIAQPFGKPTAERNDVGATMWRVISDLTHRTYYFQFATGLSMFHAQLTQFNLRAGAPIMKLDLVNHPDLSGDVTASFKPIEMKT